MTTKKTPKKKPTERWCALERGTGVWCALSPNREPKGTPVADEAPHLFGKNTVRTVCKMHLFHPADVARRKPTCEGCLWRLRS